MNTVEPSDAANSRRDFLRKGLLAGGIAAAAPVVSTFNVPAAAQVSGTTYSFQFTVGGNTPCGTATTTSSAAGTTCEPTGFVTGQNTGANVTTTGLTQANCRNNSTNVTFTLPASNSCTFTGGTVTRPGTSTCVSTTPTNSGKTLSFSSTLATGDVIRLTVTC